VHEPQFPFPSQTRLVPQAVPPVLLLPSAQVWPPVAQEYAPFLQTLGLPVQAPPAAQATQAPALLQTRSVPQPVPGVLLPPSTQVWAPVVQENVPFLQTLGLVVQEPPAVQPTQAPEPLQTRLVPQLVPADLLAPSTQVWAPVVQEVTPLLQLFGLVPHAELAVQETQVPEPLQTRLVPQPTPGAVLPPSTQVCAPVEQELVPVLQALGLPVQALPAVQEMQPPEPLQTRFTPQLAPPGLEVPFTHVDAPVVQEATPLVHGFGLPVQLCPVAHVPQNPFPSQTWLVPQVVPAMRLPPSMQVGAPVVQETTPALHCDGFPPHDAPAEHITQLPEPSQTRLVPQPVPGDLALPSTQVCAPVVHEVTPLRQSAC
jgi:hypothetical protein